MRTRYAQLDSACRAIRENYKRLSSTSQMFVEQMESKLDGLAQSYLRLLNAAFHHREYLNTTNPESIRHEARELEKGLEQQPPKVQEINRKRIEILNKRVVGDELWVAWKDPTAVRPGSDRVLMKPPPNRAARDGGDQAGLTHSSSDVRRIPMRKRQAVRGGQFTGEGFDLHHQLWGEKPGGDPGEGVLPVLPADLQRNACATC